MSNNLFKKNLSLTNVIIFPLLAAVIARGIVFYQYIHSPFRYYHTVRGLDMMTLLNNGETFLKGQTIFSPYKFLIASLQLCFGKQFLPESIIAAQMCLGVIGVAAFTFFVLHLTGRKKTALLSGLFLAVYSPLIVYETQILKAALYTFLALLSLALLLYAKKYKFNPLLSIIAGFIATQPFLERFAGILWPLMALLWIAFIGFHKYFPHFKLKKVNLQTLILKISKPVFFYTCGIALAIFSAVIINYHNGQSSKGYISANFSYLFRTGASTNANINGPQKEAEHSVIITHSTQKPSLAYHYLKKFYNILNDYQTPNNINYYFVKSKLPFLQFLIGPALLIPFALAGLIILILNKNFYKKESIIFFYAIAFITPTLAFLPLARYKLVLIPVMAFAAAYSILYIIKIRQSKHLNLQNSFFIVLPFFFLVIAMNTKAPLFREKIDLYAYSYAAVYAPTILMEQGHFKEAEKLLQDEYNKTQNTPLITVFLSASYMGQGRFKEAETLLKNEPVPSRSNVRGRYFYNLAESLRFQHKYKEAELFYKMALQTTYGQSMKKRIQNYIQLINNRHTR